MTESTKQGDEGQSIWCGRYSYKKKSETKQTNQTIPVLKVNASFGSPRSGIDAQTYVDAESNGLTSRIIRYYDESNKMTRISNHVYKRPGDFPIVHLDKPRLKLNFKRSVANPSKLARIGQPESSDYRSNTRADILRNGAIMPSISIHHREDDNIGLVELDPLVALKEISRKRIHCEDTTDTTHEKHVESIEKDSADSIPFGNSKRQRIISCSSLSESDINKRQRYSNNEIFSSLSSSSHMISLPASASEGCYLRPECIEFVQMMQNKNEEPIEPLVISDPQIKNDVEKCRTNVVEKSQLVEAARPKLTLFNKPHSKDVASASDGNGRRDEYKIAFVRPRPMTERSRASVENWLQLKPVEKKRLSLMLSCLSGELDDVDIVDSKAKTNESLVSQSTVVPQTKESLIDKYPPKEVADKIIPTPVSPTFQFYESPISPALVFATPTIALTTSTPMSTPSPVIINVSSSTTSDSKATVTAAIPTSVVTTSVATSIEQRKGGFSFPISRSTVISPEINSESVLKSSIVPPVSNITFGFQTLQSTTANVSLPTNSQVVAATKTFTFGNNSKSTNESTTSTSGSSSATVAAGTSEQTKPVLSGDASKPSSVSGFAQFSSTTPVQFGTVASCTANIKNCVFGVTTTTSPSAIILNKSQPTTFGSIASSTFTTSEQQPSFITEQLPKKDELISANQNSLFLKKTQLPVFSKSATTTAKETLDTKASNNTVFGVTSIASSKPSNSSNMSSYTTIQTTKPVSTISTTAATFTFGKPVTVSSVFNTTQPTQTSESNMFGISKTTNSSSNIFGSSTSSTPVIPAFGSTASTSNLFDQSTKMKSAEQEKAAEKPQNIFGSDKQTSSFTFSGANQPNSQQSNNIFGGTTSSTGNNSFTFRGSVQKIDPLPLSGSEPKNTFLFSGSSGEPSKSVTFGSTTGLPVFGSSNLSDTAKTLGISSNNQNAATNLFNNTSNKVSNIFSFGSNKNATVVGGNSVATTFGGKSDTSAFGGTSAPPAYGNNTSTPTFGAGVSSTFGTGVSSKFGTGATTTFGTVATSTFGTVATSTFGTGATSTFGTGATSTFGTGATSTFGNGATPTFGTGPTSTFGAGATSTFRTSVTPSFATSAPSTFGAGATSTFGSNTTTPNFGSNTTTPNFGSNTTTPNFGSKTTTPAFGSNSTAPSFGSNSGTLSFTGTTAINATSNFSGNSVATAAFSTSTGTADVNKTFNFTGSDLAPSPVPNLFNIGPGNAAPKGRTIRTAARRAYR